MVYSDIMKICKAINTNLHYTDYISNGIRCNCYRDINGHSYLEVMHLPLHKIIRSEDCTEWDSALIVMWILDSTYELRKCLGI